MRLGKSRALRLSGRVVLAAVLLVGMVAVPAGALETFAGLEIISVDSSEVVASNGGSQNDARPVMSDDGRYVVFATYDALDPADTNATWDVYRRDRVDGVTELVTVSRVGAANPNVDSWPYAVSDDGNRVLLGSYQDLVPEDTNLGQNLYVCDIDAGTYTLLDLYGDGAAFSQLEDCSLSGDGSLVVLCSYNDDFVPEDTYSTRDIYAYDVDTGEVMWVSAADMTVPEYDRGSRDPSVTDDGATVLFFTGKSLDVADTNAQQDLYTYDTATGVCTLVDVYADGSALGDDPNNIRISGDGSAVVWESYYAPFVLDDRYSSKDIYWFGLDSRELKWASRHRTGGDEIDSGSREPSISDDGRFVTFFTGKDLTVEDTNGSQDFYIVDIETGVPTRVDLFGDGSSPGSSDIYSIDMSGDAGTIVFSTDRNLDPADTNGNWDVYAAEILETVVAGSDSYSVTRNGVLTVDALTGVLPNDVASSGDPLTATVLDDVANGTLVLAPDGSFVYTPDLGFQGVDSFTYLASDGMYSGGGLVEIDVTNAIPVADAESFSVPQDGFLLRPAGTLLDGDTDANGDTLYAFKASDPAHGTVMISPDGGFVYTPTAGYFGPDSFTYVANDGQDDSLAATVSITVVATSANIAPVAVADSYSTPQDTALYVTEATGLLDNDTDADADPLTAIKVTDPGHGTVTVSSDGSFLYTPAAGYSGADSFTYKANDGTDDSASATVSLTVVAAPANIAPVAVGEAYVGVEDTALYIPEATGLLLNDTDADADPLTAIKVTDPGHGTVTVSSNGSFLYTPAAGYSGPDSFTYKANDGTDDSAPATVDITVEPADLPLTPIYRFYNRLNATHFYTNSAAEREDVLKRLWATYTYEGVAFLVDPETDVAPLYRFYNKKTGSHFYTVSADEKAQVEALYSATYTYEGVAFGVSAAAAPGKIPVYRFYNVRTGCHFYTASAAERDTVQATMAATFLYEGVGFYVSTDTN